MDARATTLIERLGLAPHPEGGFYREVFRSTAMVEPSDARDARAALTSILFLLPAGGHSRWHRVRSDEVWHFLDGERLELFRAPPDLARLERLVLGPPEADAHPVHVVPAGWWQAARASGTFGLAGCTVGPGFEFEDFEFLGDDATRLAALARIAPELAALA